MKDDENDAEEQVIKYVIVVHGIGKQRKNETIPNVVNRFAELRHGKDEEDISSILTLGKATGQTGKEIRAKTAEDCRFEIEQNKFLPWVEFEGIPQFAGPPLPSSPFLGEPSSTPGKNIRFVDMCWADIMQLDYPEVGQSVQEWADGLLGRLSRKNEWAENNPGKGAEVPQWVLKTLELLIETLVLTGKVMAFRFKEMKDLIVTKFLGDVQQYGEYSRCRGQAVRRFHKLMTRVHQKHYEEFPDIKPRYTIIAHSLGTVMSMDSIMYARAKKEIREGTLVVGPNLPFRGYLTSEEKERIEKKKSGSVLTVEEQEKLEQLHVPWIDDVKSFVTLGSPIDKYLVMWWMNYKYLLSPANWLVPRDDKIKHYNYCDEQDPVGGELDVARTAAGFDSVFSTIEDRVFTRYVIPGAAHNAYWKDLNLFKWILHNTVDQKPSHLADEPKWFLPKIYRRVLRVTYVWVPFVAILMSYFSFTWVMKSDNSIHSQAIALLVFVGAVWLGKRLIEFMIWWRLVLRARTNETWKAIRSDENMSEHVKEDLNQREKASCWFKVKSWVYLFLNILFAGVVWGFYFYNWSEQFPGKHLLLVLLAASAIAVFYARFVKFKTPAEEKREPWFETRVNLLGVFIVTLLLGGALYVFQLELFDDNFKSVLSWFETWDLKHEKFTFNLASFFTIAAYILGFRMKRYYFVKQQLKKMQGVRFQQYGANP